MKASIAERIQAALQQENLNGRLFDSFRGSDPIAENIVYLDQARLAARRWFHIAPVVGEPTKRVHAIESQMLDALPGKKRIHLSWQQVRPPLSDILAGSRRAAMQYSSLNANPYLSRADAGAVELLV